MSTASTIVITAILGAPLDYNIVRLTGLGKGPGPFFSVGKEAIEYGR